MSGVTVDRRLWLTAGGELVEQGDPDAAFLWASTGSRVDADEADRLGYKPATGQPDDDSDVPGPETCAGTTASGEPCAKKAGDDGFCHFHKPEGDQ